jgi:drug/metabolite transporter (DMT)-like permease
MKYKSSAIGLRSAPPSSGGIALAGLGVLSFSFSFPATAWALTGFGAWTAAGLRGVLAALVAGIALLAVRSPLPARADRAGLLVVAAGCAVGFPLLTTLALRTASTAHSAVVVGALPMATAALGAWRSGQRPTRLFWTAAGAGAATVLAFTLWQSHGRPGPADAFLLAALLACAAGYAEGGRLAAHLPGWRVIAWGVVLAAPVNLAVLAWALPREPVHPGLAAWAGLAYVAGISQFGGFVPWYRGMGLIGVARASQLQLAQPLLTLGWAVLLLGEHPGPLVPLTALVVLGCIVVTQRAGRVAGPQEAPGRVAGPQEAGRKRPACTVEPNPGTNSP